MSFAHAVSGNSLHNFVSENLFVCKEIAGVGRIPWSSMANDAVSGSFDSFSVASSFELAQDDRGVLYSAKTEDTTDLQYLRSQPAQPDNELTPGPTAQ